MHTSVIGSFQTARRKMMLKDECQMMLKDSRYARNNENGCNSIFHSDILAYWLSYSSFLRKIYTQSKKVEQNIIIICTHLNADLSHFEVLCFVGLRFKMLMRKNKKEITESYVLCKQTEVEATISDKSVDTSSI